MKFSDYESSHITPKYTLLEKLNLILVFLENSQLEISIGKINFDQDVGSGTLTDAEVRTIQNADFVKCNNKIFTLAGKYDFKKVGNYYNQINFTCVNSENSGDVFKLVVLVDEKTFTITGGLG